MADAYREVPLRHAASLGLVIALASASMTLAGPAAVHTGLAVAGAERVTVRVPAGAPVADYENVGYRLTRIGDSALVEVDAHPLGSRAPLPAPPDSPAPTPIDRLARRLVIGSGTQYRAVGRVLGWVARNIRYELDRSEPQSAEAVLERRRGYCTGIARLSVALLGSVGIEAREVPGFVATDGDRGGYHRWIEVYYPDRGWVFSDPSTSQNFVPATYLRLAGEQIDSEASAEGERGEIEQREDAIVVVDVHRLAPPGVLARRNVARQLASTLTVTVRDADGRSLGGAITLLHQRVSEKRPLDHGSATFVGLEGGVYTVLARLASGQEVRRRVELESRAVLAVTLEVAPSVR